MIRLVPVCSNAFANALPGLGPPCVRVGSDEVRGGKGICYSKIWAQLVCGISASQVMHRNLTRQSGAGKEVSIKMAFSRVCMKTERDSKWQSARDCPKPAEASRKSHDRTALYIILTPGLF